MRVLLPLAAPGLVASAIFAFTLSWNEFLYALVFIQDEKARTVPVGLNLLIYGDVFHWGQLMAASVITTFPVVALYVFIHRWMVEGLVAGSVKGYGDGEVAPPGVRLVLVDGALAQRGRQGQPHRRRHDPGLDARLAGDEAAVELGEVRDPHERPGVRGAVFVQQQGRGAGSRCSGPSRARAARGGSSSSPRAR